MNLNGGKIMMLNDEQTATAVGGTAKGAEWKFQGMTYYRVAQGDTLSEIARRFNTSSEAIKALNPVLIKNLDGLRVGMELRVL
jgi:LysM repeat protein